MSGIDERSLAAVEALYGRLVERTVPVSGPKEAELTKLLENTFRHVNIALINEVAMFAHELGIDAWEAVEAASTKPFGYLRFTPGPGVGGHCLPIDPSYLSWRVKDSLGHAFRFVELANDINAHMPDYVVRRLQDHAQRAGRGRARAGGSCWSAWPTSATPATPGRRPAGPIARLLRDLGADVRGADPHVTEDAFGPEVTRVDADRGRGRPAPTPWSCWSTTTSSTSTSWPEHASLRARHPPRPRRARTSSTCEPVTEIGRRAASCGPPGPSSGPRTCWSSPRPAPPGSSTRPSRWPTPCVAFAAFCLAASGTYLLNDVADREADARHPTKHTRPDRRRRRVPPATATVVGVLAILGGVALGLLADWHLSVTVGIYVAVTTAYSHWLKHVVILDVVAVASGFVLRAIGGATATGVPVSDWFFIVTSFGSLFVVTGKRQGEVGDLAEEEGEAGDVRKTLDEYSTSYLAYLRTVSSGVMFVAYCVWAFETADAAGAGSVPWFELSILPFVVAVLRYALLLDRGQGGTPEELFFRDRPLQLAGAGLGPRLRHRRLPDVSELTGWSRTAPTRADGGPAHDDRRAGRHRRRRRRPGRDRPGPRPLLRRRGPERGRDGGRRHRRRARSWPSTARPGSSPPRPGSASTTSCASSSPRAGSCRCPPAPATSPSAAPSPPTSTARTTTGTARSWPTSARCACARPPAWSRSAPTRTPTCSGPPPGGMGLTGVVLDATFALMPIPSSRLLVDTERTTDLDDALDRMTRGDDGYRFTVAWIDLMATGAPWAGRC